MSELRKELERRIKAEPWEADEDIITVDGVPIGMTLSRRNSRVVRDWLCGAWRDLARSPLPRSDAEVSHE